MSKPNSEQVEKYLALDKDHLIGAGKLANALEQADKAATHEGLFMVGQLEVRHEHGYRIGWLNSHEEWWVFVPDYSDDEPIDHGA